MTSPFAQWSQTLTAKDALAQTVELAQVAEEIGIDGAFVCAPALGWAPKQESRVRA